MQNPEKLPTIVFGQPTLTEDEIQEVVATLRSGWIGTGPKAQAFEKAFAAYQNVPYAAAVSSCTAALTLALRACGVGSGDEVIVPAMTFAATINAVIHVGATPVLVDVEPKFFCLDLEKVEAAITKKTKAVIPVHFAGAPADVTGLMRLKEKHGFYIVHDCAHAIETEWNEKKVGSYADISCFSFYSTKNLTTIEGGMVCSNNADLVEKARTLSSHGLSRDAWKRFSASGFRHYDVVVPGYKNNFTDVQASLGLWQLKAIEENLKKRQKVWDLYQSEFKNLPIRMPSMSEKGNRHGLHLFTVLVEEGPAPISRDRMLEELQKNGVGCGVHYRAIPQFTFYRAQFNWQESHFPVAVRIGNSTLSLPLTPYLTEAQLSHIVNTVKAIFDVASSKRAA